MQYNGRLTIVFFCILRYRNGLRIDKLFHSLHGNSSVIFPPFSHHELNNGPDVMDQQHQKVPLVMERLLSKRNVRACVCVCMCVGGWIWMAGLSIRRRCINVEPKVEILVIDRKNKGRWMDGLSLFLLCL